MLGRRREEEEVEEGEKIVCQVLREGEKRPTVSSSLRGVNKLGLFLTVMKEKLHSTCLSCLCL